MREIAKEMRKGADYTFTFRRYINAIQVVPSAATVTVYNNNGATQQTGAATIATDGTMTYTLLAVNNNTLNNNFKIVLAWTYNSITYQDAALFDVVLQPIENITTDSDLYLFLPEMRRKIYTLEGETDNNGNLSQLQDEALKADDRDWTGGKIELFVEENKVHEADISAYSKTNGTISFSPAWYSTIGNAFKYVIRESFKTLIDTAFNDFVIPDIRRLKGLPAGGYIDSYLVKSLVIYKAIEIYCFGNMETENDKWNLRYKDFKEKYSTTLTNFSAPYDADEDAEISDNEDNEKQSFGTRRIKR